MYQSYNVLFKLESYKMNWFNVNTLTNLLWVLDNTGYRYKKDSLYGTVSSKIIEFYTPIKQFKNVYYL